VSSEARLLEEVFRFEEERVEEEVDVDDEEDEDEDDEDEEEEEGIREGVVLEELLLDEVTVWNSSTAVTRV
jgi:hypothetical protein